MISLRFFVAIDFILRYQKFLYNEKQYMQIIPQWHKKSFFCNIIWRTLGNEARSIIWFIYEQEYSALNSRINSQATRTKASIQAKYGSLRRG